nr:hypothetical protein [Sphingopyxis sp.]
MTLGSIAFLSQLGGIINHIGSSGRAPPGRGPAALCHFSAQKPEQLIFLRSAKLPLLIKFIELAVIEYAGTSDVQPRSLCRREPEAGEQFQNYSSLPVEHRQIWCLNSHSIRSSNERRRGAKLQLVFPGKRDMHDEHAQQLSIRLLQLTWRSVLRYALPDSLLLGRQIGRYPKPTFDLGRVPSGGVGSAGSEADRTRANR